MRSRNISARCFESSCATNTSCPRIVTGCSCIIQRRISQNECTVIKGPRNWHHYKYSHHWQTLDGRRTSARWAFDYSYPDHLYPVLHLFVKCSLLRILMRTSNKCNFPEDTRRLRDLTRTTHSLLPSTSSSDLCSHPSVMVYLAKPSDASEEANADASSGARSANNFGWSNLAKALQESDVAKIQDCKEDIDTLLVVVSLYV